MKVFVYYNLHKKCLSIRALDGLEKGRVIKHTNSIILKDVIFKVSQSGRERVIKEKRKNVHAGVVGTIISPLDLFGVVKREKVVVTYNPYYHKSFVEKVTNDPIDGSIYAIIEGKAITAYGPKWNARALSTH